MILFLWHQLTIEKNKDVQAAAGGYRTIWVECFGLWYRGKRKAKQTKTQRSSRLFGKYYLYKKRHRSGKKCQLVNRDDEVKLRFLGFQERPGHYLIEKNTNLVNISRCQVCGTVFE
jgi:hypothetical protein